MNEEEKKAIEDIKRTIELYEIKPIDKISVEFDEFDYKIFKTILNLLQTQQAEIEKKDKIIDLMGEKIFEEGIVWENKEDVKQYYERKVENGN